jgi:hypothetical protein
VQNRLLSSAHTIPFEVPDAEIEGVLPGNANPPAGCVPVRDKLNVAVAVLSW